MPSEKLGGVLQEQFIPNGGRGAEPRFLPSEKLSGGLMTGLLGARRRVVCLALALMLSACGGDGGSGDNRDNDGLSSAPGTGNLSIGPGNGNLSAGPGTGNLSAGPGTGNLSAGPGTGNLSIGPGDGNLSIGPGDGKSTIPDGNSSIGDAGSNSTQAARLIAIPGNDAISVGLSFSAIAELWNRIDGASVAVALHSPAARHSLALDYPLPAGEREWRLALDPLPPGDYLLNASFVSSAGAELATTTRQISINHTNSHTDIHIAFDRGNARGPIAAPPLQDEDGDGYLEILTAEQLADLRADLSGSYELMADLDFSNRTWQPIGPNAGSPFGGRLRGNGHTISGLHLTGGDYVGFFGALRRAVISELNLEIASLSGSNYAGGLAGTAIGTEVSDLEVTITESFNLTRAVAGGAEIYLGGVFGYAKQMQLAEITVSLSAPVSAAAAAGDLLFFGGLAGALRESSAKEIAVHAAEDILLTGARQANYAGLAVGELLDSAAANITVTGNGSISTAGFASLPQPGAWHMGAIAGSIRASELAGFRVDGARVLRAWVQGDVSVGGLAGGAYDSRIGSPREGKMEPDLDGSALYLRARSRGGAAMAGGVAGVLSRSRADDLDIFTPHLEALSSAAPARAGGIAGYAEHSLINRTVGSSGGWDGHLINASSLQGAALAGGIAGEAQDTKIMNILHYALAARVHSQAHRGAAYAGGIVGRAGGSANISDAALIFLIEVTARGATETFAGGLAGYLRDGALQGGLALYTSARAESSAAAGQLANNYAGGFVGFCAACRVADSGGLLRGLEVDSKNPSAIGGMIGGSSGNASIAKSYVAVSNFITNQARNNVASFAGGLFGWSLADEHRAPEVAASYYAAGVSLAGLAEGLEDYTGALDTTLTDPYDAARELAQFSCATGADSSCAAAAAELTFEGWDEERWIFANDLFGIPILRWAADLF